MKKYAHLFYDENLKQNLCFLDNIPSFEDPICEAISKEQKEKGQREMLKDTVNPLKKLRWYLNNKWANPKTKEQLIQKNKEFAAFDRIVGILNKEDYKGDENAMAYYKAVIGKNHDGIHVFDTDYSTGVQTRESKKDKEGKSEKIPYLLLDPGIDSYLNGFLFNFNKEEIVNKVFDFKVRHELGHIYEYLKDLIENGKAEIVDTRFEKNRDKVKSSEHKANAYAIDNMYRKDRRELLKNGVKLNGKIEKEYNENLKDYSKTYKKTLDSIEKEKKYFNY